MQQPNSPPTCIFLFSSQDQKSQAESYLLSQKTTALINIISLTPSNYTETPIPKENSHKVKILALDTSKMDLILPILKNYPEIEWIHICWSGINGFINPDFLNFKGTITNGKGVSVGGLSQFVMFSILWYAKKAWIFRKQKKVKEWKRCCTRGLKDLTLGKKYLIKFYLILFFN